MTNQSNGEETPGDLDTPREEFPQSNTGITDPRVTARLLRFDFIGETGELLITAGAAIAAAASAENIEVLELALRQARTILLECIGEFKALAATEGGGE